MPKLPMKYPFKKWVLATILFVLLVATPEVKCNSQGSGNAGSETRADPALVTVIQGQIRGTKERSHNGKEFYSFRGIPFVKPPLGDLRFQPPQEGDGWEGVLAADKHPSVCPQIDALSTVVWSPPTFVGDEDCLYLNVFSPMNKVHNGGPLLPVMVWIHGGGFQFGESTSYQPYALLDKDIVLVTIQYRLNTLGFLSLEDDVAPGNMGLLDQTAALRWVQKNIRQFGGNPDLVTIFGESAGAASVHYHTLSPNSEGLFHRAIVQSGSAINGWAVTTNHRQVAYYIAKKLNCGTASKFEPQTSCPVNPHDPDQYESCIVDQMPSSAILKCLRQATAQELVTIPLATLRIGFFPLVTGPRVHGNFLRKSALKLVKERGGHKVDIMIGITKDEGAFFAVPPLVNPEEREKLNRDFDELAPVLAYIGEGGNAEDLDPKTQTQKIFNFYIGKTNLTLGDLDGFVALLSDSLIWYGVDATAHYLASDSRAQRENKKLFVYQFNYLPKAARPGVFDLGIQKKYVSHTDELLYLFSAPYPHPWFGPPLETEEDINIRDSIVEMWTNFAKTGNPTPDGRWKPYTADAPRQFLIDTVQEMDYSESKKEIRQFWRQLPLKINQELFSSSIVADSGAPTPKHEL